MKPPLEPIRGGVLAARGYRAGAAASGLKSAAKALDLAVLVSDRPATAAGAFTRNRVAGAPVQVDRERLPSRRVRGVVVNSGNANACTGAAGLRDARAMCAQAAACFGTGAEEFLVASTGIIGERLPMAKIRRGIDLAARNAATGLARARAFARAIMTTDTRLKQFAANVAAKGGEFRIGGGAKGSGMIAPNMATMLCFITTDADVLVRDLARVTRRATDRSFNCISVDGHTSTSDTLIVLANGASGVKLRGAELGVFEHALTSVCIDLARQVVRDGEGATKLVTINVAGAPTDAQAKTVALAIANSPLVKTAVHGGDPNWGRIVSAAGYAGVSFEPGDARLAIGGVNAFASGRPVAANRPALASRMAAKEIDFDLVLGRGPGKATVWTCDLSKRYITINAEYHT